MKGLTSAAKGAAASAVGSEIGVGTAVAGMAVGLGWAVGASSVTWGLKDSWVGEAEFEVGLASGVASLHAVTNMNATIIKPDQPVRRRFDLATRAVVQSTKGFANGILARIIGARLPCR